jgi:dolichol-phosphate mannosyltransferase
MVTVTFFAGIQLLSICLIAEYIGKIYDESKGRPEYIISERINIDDEE